MKQERRKFLKQLGVFSAGVSLFPVSAAGNYAAEAGANSCAPCTLDYYGEGPFYTKNPPEIKNGQLADSNEAGERLIISGRVTNNDCTEYIENAVIDVWHADDSGAYDNTGYKLRGKTKSDNQGYYSFETIKPGKYLNGNEYRPSHIHFKITAPGKSTLTTQLYFEGDTSIKNDAAASIESGTYDATDRIIPLSKENGIFKGTWDIALDAIGKTIETGVHSEHIDKGMIYSVYPNPFVDRMTIKIGVFKNANIALNLYDVSGSLLDSVNKGGLVQDKYEIEWIPKNLNSSGIYLLAIKVNDLEVQTIRVVKA
mgnify:CR=1 FL=1